MGEGLGLEWRDVDFDEQTLQVRRALAWVGGTPTLGEPKLDNTWLATDQSPGPISRTVEPRPIMTSSSV